MRKITFYIVEATIAIAVVMFTYQITKIDYSKYACEYTPLNESYHQSILVLQSKKNRL